MAKILFIEDDSKYASLIADFLRSQHFVIEVTDTAEEARAFLQAFNYDLLIVDWHLPDTDGPSLVRSFRASGLNVPVLMLTARGEISDKEHGFDCGADDYLTKAADPRELSARVRALLRRPVSYAGHIIEVRNVRIDVSTHTVTKDGVVVHLLPKEFAVLEFMVKNPNRVYSAEELLDRLWPSDTEATTHTVRSCINKLRTKLDDQDNDSLILTKYKAGYQINAKVTAKS